jgi:uncharacterized membrane protein YdbT with pleckstrin-like domain
MSYVQGVLRPDERVLGFGRIHWVVYLPGLALLVLAALALAVFGTHWVVLTIAALLALAGFGLAFNQFVRSVTTEIAVTTLRVIKKTGLIRRDTVEISMSKIESVDVSQTIAGRILGYGTVTVRGTGAGLEPLRTIADPLALREHIIAG